MHDFLFGWKPGSFSLLLSLSLSFSLLLFEESPLLYIFCFSQDSKLRYKYLSNVYVSALLLQFFRRSLYYISCLDDRGLGILLLV